MTPEDPIRRLLRRADERFAPDRADRRDAPRDARSRDLAARVRNLDRQRRQRARAWSAALPVAVLALGVALWSNWRAPPTIHPAPGREQPGAEPNIAVAEQPALDDFEIIARLRAEAALHEQIAQAMIAARAYDRASDEARRERLRGDPLDEAQDRLDNVAFRMIVRADRLRASMQPSEEAVAIYRDVVRLFPATTSAEVARQRLAQHMN